MTQNEELDPGRLTFSQTQGYEELPRPLALGEISYEARLKLWDLLVLSVWHKSGNIWFWNNKAWVRIFQTLHGSFWLRPVDESTSRADRNIELYKGSILEDSPVDLVYVLPFNKVLDLFQMIMRHPECPREFTLGVARVFEECRLAYVVDTEEPPTILPAATKAEGEAVVGAIEELREAGLQGAETHLKKAGELINGGDWPGSVRESIHAVESVARQLDPDASKTLGPALASLESSGRLHPALKEAFSKLYGHTSDEEGIRHALLDNATSPAGRDEAVFMVGACASFASYLWRSRQEG